VPSPAARRAHAPVIQRRGDGAERAGGPKLFLLLLGLVEEYPGDFALLDERPARRIRRSVKICA
jgi:hypothetical protein